MEGGGRLQGLLRLWADRLEEHEGRKYLEAREMLGYLAGTWADALVRWMQQRVGSGSQVRTIPTSLAKRDNLLDQESRRSRKLRTIRKCRGQLLVITKRAGWSNRADIPPSSDGSEMPIFDMGWQLVIGQPGAFPTNHPPLVPHLQWRQRPAH